MKLYLSGPMTGYLKYNRPRFNEAAQFLRKNGFDVFNPAEIGLDDWVSAIKVGVRNLPDYHALVQLEGWDKSRGARLEKYIADHLCMEIWQYNAIEEHLARYRAISGFVTSGG